MKCVPQFNKEINKGQSKNTDREWKEFHEVSGRIASGFSKVESTIMDIQTDLKKLLDMLDEENDIGTVEDPLNKTPPTPSFAEVHEESAVSSIENECQIKSTALQMIKGYVEGRLGWHATTWFDGLELVQFTDKEIVLCTDSEFKQDIIKRRLSYYIKDAIKELYDHDVDIKIILHQDGTC